MYSRAGHDLFDTWWHDHLTREPNIYNAFYHHKRVLRVALLLVSCLFTFITDVDSTHVFFFLSLFVHSNYPSLLLRHVCRVPYPRSRGRRTLLEAGSGTDLTQVKRPQTRTSFSEVV